MEDLRKEIIGLKQSIKSLTEVINANSLEVSKLEYRIKELEKRVRE
jgi:hypothetical protein